jgi:hypothetical protein
MTEYKIPLRNRTKEIVDYAIVSEEDFEHLNKIKWSKLPMGYVQATIKNEPIKMHRYIMINLIGLDINPNVHIDHINHNKLDNRRENLKPSSLLENLKNKKKPINSISKYNYVSFDKSTGKWIASINKLKKIYDYEEHAAYQINLWLKQDLTLNQNKYNPIEKPEDFVEHQERKKNPYPKGVSFKQGWFLARINIDGKEYTLGKFNNAEEAIACRLAKDEELAKEKQEKILSTPIKRNKDNIPIIEIDDKKTKKILEVLVDEDNYYDLVKHIWHTNNDGYVKSQLKRKSLNMARIIMKYDGDDVIDHIDGNKLDNRKQNLRISTVQENAMNRASHKNSSSKYIGVAFITNTKKWKATIQDNDKKTVHLGFFDEEEEAARVRDEATIKYRGNKGRLNFLEEK